jgi:hypothetical protein
MDFKSAKQLGACLARDYSEAFFRLLVNYRDIAASEAASRLGIHIRTAQDFLETLSELGVLSREEVSEGKRPYFRYSLAQRKIGLDIDLDTLLANAPAEDSFERRVRERKGSGAQFSTARSGKHIASVTTWSGNGRDRTSRRINLTTPQGLFLYHLPFPTAEPMSIAGIMEKAGVGDEHKGEIADLVEVLLESGVLETM